MQDHLVINDQIAIPRDELKFTFSRSPGPGGQNVNKVNSKATLKWSYAGSPWLRDDIKRRFGQLFGKRINADGELILSSSRFREQRRNVDDCLEKLKQLVLAAAVVPKVRKRPKRSAAANAKRLEKKRRRGERKTTPTTAEVRRLAGGTACRILKCRPDAAMLWRASNIQLPKPAVESTPDAIRSSHRLAAGCQSALQSG